MGGFELSGRLLRWVNLWNGMGNRNRYLGTVSNVDRCFFCMVFDFSVRFLRFFFNCVFYAFYKENQGLEVPRETRLEKLMRLLEVSKQMHGGKAELSTKTIFGMYFRCKSQIENQGSCSGGWT